MEVNLRSCSSIFGRKLVNGKKIAENQINNLETSKSGHRYKKPGKENCYLCMKTARKLLYAIYEDILNLSGIMA